MSKTAAEVKASSPIRTSLYEREGSMWGSLKRPSPRRSMVMECRSDDSDFCRELISTYGFTETQMHRAAERYQLGRSKSGQTIFWMMDDLGICRDGHIGDAWVSQMLKGRYPDLAQYIRPRHCLFGLLSLAESAESAEKNSHTEITESTEICSQKPVGLVESERSAVILSEVCPKLHWLAYVYPANFTVDQLEPLQGRKVTIYPPTDPCQETFLSFLELADQARRLYHFDISVDDTLEQHASEAQKARHIDLVDFLFE